MTATHNIKNVTVDQDFIYLQIDGMEFKVLTNKVSKKLSEATELQRKLFTISPSGYGIHWPLVDEDLSINSLIKITQL